LEISERQIPFRVSDVTDLIEPRHRVPNMRRICHRLFAPTGECESRGRQRSFLRRGKVAMRCRAIGFPSGFRHGFIFHSGFHFTNAAIFMVVREYSYQKLVPPDSNAEP
jgi:hypothetical protein